MMVNKPVDLATDVFWAPFDSTNLPLLFKTESINQKQIRHRTTSSQKPSVVFQAPRSFIKSILHVKGGEGQP